MSAVECVIAVVCGLLLVGAACFLLGERAPRPEAQTLKTADKARQPKAAKRNPFAESEKLFGPIKPIPFRDPHATKTKLELTNDVRKLAISDDGTLLATFNADPAHRPDFTQAEIIRIWDLRTGEVKHTLNQKIFTSESVFSPDNRYLACIGTPGLTVWDLEKRQQIHERKLRMVFDQSISFTSDSSTVVASTYFGVAILDVVTGELRQITPGFGAVSSVDCYPAERNIFVVANTHTKTSSVQFWDLDSLQIVKAIPDDGPGYVRFSRDGRRLVYKGSKGIYHVLETNGWSEIAKFGTNKYRYSDYEFSADGSMVLAKHLLASRSPYELWFAATGESMMLLAATPDSRTTIRSRDAVFAPNGVVILSTGSNGIWFFDPADRKWVPMSAVTGDIDRMVAAHRARTRPTATPDPTSTRTASSSNERITVKETIHEDPAQQLAAKPTDRPETEPATIAVLALENTGTSVKYASIGKAIAELLINDLSVYQGVRCVERAASSALIKEQDIAKLGPANANAGDNEPSTLTADFVIAGTFQGDEKTTQAAVELRAVDGNKPLVQWTISGPTDDLLALEQQLVVQITKALHLEDSDRRSAREAESGPSPLVAVMPFRNLSPSAEDDALQSGVAELLQADLSILENVRLVERSEIEKVLAEQQLSAAGLLDHETAIRVGRLLGADRLITGSFLRLNDLLRVQSRVVDPATTTVLASQHAQGREAGFAGLLETLTLSIVGDLAIAPPAGARRLLEQALPVRNLEAAIHYARGARFMRQGHWPEASTAYEQALVVEPSNVYLHVSRVRALHRSRNWPEMIAAAEKALVQHFNIGQIRMKMDLYRWLIQAGRSTGRNELREEYATRLQVEFPSQQTKPKDYERAIAFINTGRRSDAIELLERITVEEIEDEEWYVNALVHLYIQYRSKMRSTRVRFRNREAAAEIGAKAVAVFDRIVITTFKRSPKYDARLMRQLIDYYIPLSYRDENGRLQDFYTYEELVEAYKKTFRISGLRHWRQYFDLGQLHDENEQWRASLGAFESLLRLEVKYLDGLPNRYDINYYKPAGLEDLRLESAYRIARALHKQGNIQQAFDAYQMVVRDYGVVNFVGPKVLLALRELNAEPAELAKTALIWGGYSDGKRAWQTVLEPAGYNVHCVQMRQVTAAQLSPYDLVVLVRSGHQPYTPTEILALRSYVATGGALLAVVSPGWEPAQPSLHNSLLSFFGIQAGTDSTVRAVATSIAKHPITAGIEASTAKTAAGLTAPESASLIRGENGTLLAALDYGEGRVVVASYGQWFLPDLSEYGRVWWGSRSRDHWTGNLPYGDLPVEVDERAERALLDNVIKWLGEERHRSPEFVSQRRRLREAQLVVRKAQAQVVPWQQMKAAMHRLAADASPGFWKQESLWVAAEAFQQLCYTPNDDFLSRPRYHHPGNSNIDANPRFYEDLVRQFPESPLRPFAQWRLGECARRQLMGRNRVTSRRFRLTNAEAPLEVFRQVDAHAGTYAWAWTQIRMGEAYLIMNDFQQALPHFEAVAERMPAGPEKIIALAGAGHAYRLLGRTAEARRRYQTITAFPDIFWWGGADYYALWQPFNSNQSGSYITSTRWVKRSLGELEE